MKDINILNRLDICKDAKTLQSTQVCIESLKYDLVKDGFDTSETLTGFAIVLISLLVVFALTSIAWKVFN
jgi:hypothetical protein